MSPARSGGGQRRFSGQSCTMESECLVMADVMRQRPRELHAAVERLGRKRWAVLTLSQAFTGAAKLAPTKEVDDHSE